MERIAWLVFGAVVLTAALRANGSARARRIGAVAFAALFIGAGALPGDRTRLVTRLRVAHELRQPAGILLLELGDWPMMRRLLRGIRERAEDEHPRAAGAAA